MIFTIRQKIFSWSDSFTVWDEQGRDCYYVQGELFSWGRRLHITDTQGREAALVAQKVMTWLPRFDVITDGVCRAQIVKEMTFFQPRYRIDGLDWIIEGDFLDHDYEIRRQGQIIACIRKQWFTWADCYVIDIADPAQALTALAVVLAIDCVAAANQ